MERADEVSQIFHSFTAGNIEVDECFCMVLSIEGYEKTRNEFLERINIFKHTDPNKLRSLRRVYVTYFQLGNQAPYSDFTDPVGVSVENGFLTSDFGYELDMEMALSNSFSQQNLGGDYHQTGTVNEHSKSYANVVDNKNRSGSLENCKAISEKDVGTYAQFRNTHLNSKVQHTCTITSHKMHVPGLSIETTKTKNKRKKKSSRCENDIQRPLSSKPVIYWIRRDLRLYDNPALNAAQEEGAPVIFTFLWAEKEEDPNNVVAMGGATKLWLHHALQAFNNDLVEKYGTGIVYRKTDNSVKEMKRLFAETDAKCLVINNVYEPFLTCRDDKLCKDLQDRGVTCKRFDSYLLHEPSSVTTESIGMRGIGSVTHFMEICRQSATKPIGHPLDTPRHLPKVHCVPDHNHLDELELAKMPRRKDGTVIDWAAPIRKQWDFGETGAWNALELFFQEGIRKYEKESCRADNLNTCRISPYLHFGQISPRAVLTQARGMKSPKFMRKLAWRDLSYWLLSLWPELPSQPIRVHYRDQRWSDNSVHLKAWQKGKTGFPLIDAAMRQLWQTGWMNNYMRHVVASFLISYLHLHWVEGYRWFQDTLVDADVAINSMMWQNGGMSGLDQWNFVMHPVDAALTCDPDGAFVRTWCPELARLPNDFIHQPWKCPPSILKRSLVDLGVTYPQRILTKLEEAREQSLKDVVTIRMKYPHFVDKHSGNDLVPLPSGLLLPCITRREFKYKTSNPEAKDNPHTAVLRGYRSRKRDEAVAFANQRDFTASTMNEFVMRKERHDRASQFSSAY